MENIYNGKFTKFKYQYILQVMCLKEQWNNNTNPLYKTYFTDKIIKIGLEIILKYCY